MKPELSTETSNKMRFFSFLSMFLLVFVHGYNLQQRYLQPFTSVTEPLTVTTYTEYFLANGIFRFRIPMLFAISGYLFALHDEQPFGWRIRKRMRTLLLPYFLWSIIGLATAVVFYYWSWIHSAVVNAHLQPTDKTFGQFSFTDWINAILWPVSFQLWFIRSLFFYNLLYPVLKAAIMKFPKMIFTILIILWLGYFGFFVLEGEGLLFFTFGIWLCKKRKNIDTKPNWLSLKVFLFLFVAVTGIKTMLAFKGFHFLQGRSLAITLLILHRCVEAAGLIVAWYGMDKLAKAAMSKKWFSSISGFAFFIYALHVPLVTYLIDPVNGLFRGFRYFRILNFFLLPAMIIIFCVAAGWLLRKYLPAVYAILTGSRGLAISEKETIIPKKAMQASL